MSISAYIFLLVLFFITSAVGVVTGSNSLLTVPVMLQFGLDAKVAVATNMFGLTFMSIGASVPFLRERSVDFRRLPFLILLTLIGSGLGACLVGLVKAEWMPVVLSACMLIVIVFILFNRTAVGRPQKSLIAVIAGYVLAFMLAIYGGFFSGGYVTMLTAVFVGLVGMTTREAIGTTKVINIFSSLIATIVFMLQGLVDYRLGAALAVTMFIAAFLGAQFAVKMNERWLRFIFISVVIILAVKMLVDSIGQHLVSLPQL